MLSRFGGMWGAIALLVVVAPAQARRTAIDQNPDGTPLLYELGGYCDFNGDECGAGDGATLPYSVSFGGAPATDRLWVHGNSIVTFGDSANFGSAALADPINNGDVPALTAYDRTLVSAGQDVGLDFNSGGFFQSAKLKIRGNGSIVATWFTCFAPTSPSTCPAENQFTLLLRPTAEGFLGTFDFAQGFGGDDIGYVIDGTFTPTGDSFLMPATFSGNISFVPEPQSWALLIAGFGLTGAALRRRRALFA